MYSDIFSPLSVNHFIRKPINNEDLLKRINEVIIVDTTVSISKQWNDGLNQMTDHRRTEDLLYRMVSVKDKQRSWKRILIVDDDVDVTITFKAVIQSNYLYYLLWRGYRIE